MTRTCSRLLMVSGRQNNLLSEPNSPRISVAPTQRPLRKLDLPARKSLQGLESTGDRLRTRVCGRTEQCHEDNQTRSQRCHRCALHLWWRPAPSTSLWTRPSTAAGSSSPLVLSITTASGSARPGTLQAAPCGSCPAAPAPAAVLRAPPKSRRCGAAPAGRPRR